MKTGEQTTSADRERTFADMVAIALGAMGAVALDADTGSGEESQH